MQVTLYSARDIAWHRWAPPVVPVCAAVRVAALAPVARYSAGYLLYIGCEIAWHRWEQPVVAACAVVPVAASVPVARYSASCPL